MEFVVPESRVEYQRDLYRLLLDLNSPAFGDFSDALSHALQLIVGLSGANQGYIEVRREDGELVYTSHSLSQEDVDNIQIGISTGIIAEALSTGESVLTPSALFDPRFNTRESVQRGRIEAVFCAPLAGNRTRGVLYLQGDFQSGAEGVKFDAEAFARRVSPLLDQLLVDNETPAGRQPMTTLRDKYQLSEIVGSSEPLYQAVRSAMMVAPLAVNVLLTGSSGTGKSQLARVIHANSGREAHPFMEVNCAALPETLIENELFGAIKGAHSGAVMDVEGKVGGAHGGTLFLDEIGSMPLTVQGKLLQFLQSGEYYPLGSSKILKSDARVVFATNNDLERAVRDGAFREDLFYRINTFPIRMPDLRERGADIEELADNLCLLTCAKHQFRPITVSRPGKQLLRNHDWPGNVRELSHLLETACIRAAFEEASVLTADHLSRVLPDGVEAGTASGDDQSFQKATQTFQAELIQQALTRAGGNVSEASRQLKISRTHLHHLIKTLGIKA